MLILTNSANPLETTLEAQDNHVYAFCGLLAYPCHMFPNKNWGLVGVDTLNVICTIFEFSLNL